jgi:hypothetical protein
MPPDYFTPAQVAERLHMSIDLVGDHIRAGSLAAIDVRRPGARRASYRVSAAALAEYERARQVRAVPMPGREVRARRRKKVATGFREYF